MGLLCFFSYLKPKLVFDAMVKKAFTELRINGGHAKKVLRSLDRMLSEIHPDVPGLLFSYFKTRKGKKLKI
jgi:hypothetical protein